MAQSAPSKMLEQAFASFAAFATLALLVASVYSLAQNRLEREANVAGFQTADENALTWAPPEGWEGYQVVTLAEAPSLMRSWSGDECTAINNNLIIDLPDTPLTEGVNLEGGGNIVIIGGEIQIPWQGDDADISSRRAIKIQDCANSQPERTVHIEGLRIGIDDISANCSSGEFVRTNMDPDCSDLSEGIQVAAPNSIIQLQNIRVNHIHARDQQDFTDNHPDVVQTWGSFKELRIDKLTGSSDYQGIFMKEDFNSPRGAATIKRSNITGDPTARQLFWSQPSAGSEQIVLDDVWITPSPDYPWGFGATIWPDDDGTLPDRATISQDESDRNYATWTDPAMEPAISGRVTEGPPPGGDFVLNSAVGLAYVSPGYDSAADTTAPVASAISGTPASTSISISWTSDEESSSQIEYGIIPGDFSTITTETNTSPRVTSHSQSLTGLIPCQFYAYRVRTRDAANNSAVSGAKTFYTTGCLGSAGVDGSIAQSVASTGGSVTLSNGRVNVVLTAPNAYKSTAHVFQIKELARAAVLATAAAPSGQSLVGDNALELTMLASPTTTATPDTPVTVRIYYSQSSLSSLVESSIGVYRWSGSAWEELDDCTLNTSSNYVQCDFSSFSNYAVFAQQSSDTTPPSISAVSATPAKNSITISWTTNEPSSTRVEYGKSANLGSTTAEKDSTGVTSHSQIIPGLQRCQLYYYKVISQDGSNNSSTSSLLHTTTTGCSTSQNDDDDNDDDDEEGEETPPATPPTTPPTGHVPTPTPTPSFPESMPVTPRPTTLPNTSDSTQGFDLLALLPRVLLLSAVLTAVVWLLAHLRQRSE
jgi:hypothetical protein